METLLKWDSAQYWMFTCSCLVCALWNLGKYFNCYNGTHDVCLKPTAHFDEGCWQDARRIAVVAILLPFTGLCDWNNKRRSWLAPARGTWTCPKCETTLESSSRRIVAAPFSLWLAANECGTKLARPLQLPLWAVNGGHCVAGRVIKALIKATYIECMYVASTYIHCISIV